MQVARDESSTPVAMRACVCSQLQPEDQLCQLRNKSNPRLENPETAGGKSLSRIIFFPSCVLISCHICASTSSVAVRLLENNRLIAIL